MKRKIIKTNGDIEIGLEALGSADPRLRPIIDAAGEVPLRLSRPGYEGLARIIISQQVSKASADAITARTLSLCRPLNAQSFAATDDDTRKAMGLSRPKQRTMQAIADAVIDGELDLDGICDLAPEDAKAKLVQIKGIGPWTAEVYLMFCAGHADIFPAGDLALQIAAHEALDLKARPTEKELRFVAESWAPWRAVAARLLWAWYGQSRNRDIMP